MKPFDVRLLAYARAARRSFIIGAFLVLVKTVALISWCWALANLILYLITPVLKGTKYGAVLELIPPAESWNFYLLLACGALLLRAITTWLLEFSSAHAGNIVKAQLREQALEKFNVVYPSTLKQGASGRALVLGRGLEALDAYFAKYLPQLILTVIATPIIVVVLFIADRLSATVVVIVFPVIPLFMVLIGIATKRAQTKHWEQLQSLSSHFLDVVTGLATLRIFGREQHQRESIAKATEHYRQRTMQVLRVTFLSGFVLDLAGTFSVALVAVTVGTRLISGDMSLLLGIFVLLLLPEAFIPIRQVGVAYHAAAEGLAAADEYFADLNELQKPAVAAVETGTSIKAIDLTVQHNAQHTVIGPVSFTVHPGEIVALAGSSGAGKSSIVRALMGLLPLAAGRATAPAITAFVDQRARLMQGSVKANICLGVPELDECQVTALLAEVGLSGIDPLTKLGINGQGVSGGQAQRIAVARALAYADAHPGAALVLDEPSSALDAAAEQHLIAALLKRAQQGHPVLLVTHREQLLRAADRVIEVREASAELNNTAVQAQAATVHSLHANSAKPLAAADTDQGWGGS